MFESNKVGNMLRWAFIGLAVLSAILGIIFFLVILIAGGGPEAPRVTSLLAIALGFFYLVFFTTISEVLRLLMKLESNTRKDDSELPR